MAPAVLAATRALPCGQSWGLGRASWPWAVRAAGSVRGLALRVVSELGGGGHPEHGPHARLPPQTRPAAAPPAPRPARPTTAPGASARRTGSRPPPCPASRPRSVSCLPAPRTCSHGCRPRVMGCRPGRGREAEEQDPSPGLLGLRCPPAPPCCVLKRSRTHFWGRRNGGGGRPPPRPPPRLRCRGRAAEQNSLCDQRTNACSGGGGRPAFQRFSPTEAAGRCPVSGPVCALWPGPGRSQSFHKVRPSARASRGGALPERGRGCPQAPPRPAGAPPAHGPAPTPPAPRPPQCWTPELLARQPWPCPRRLLPCLGGGGSISVNLVRFCLERWFGKSFPTLKNMF